MQRLIGAGTPEYRSRVAPSAKTHVRWQDGTATLSGLESSSVLTVRDGGPGHCQASRSPALWRSIRCRGRRPIGLRGHHPAQYGL